MMDGDPPPAAAATGKCPICGGAKDVKYRPFCSKRCADIDLARWLHGSYVIAGGQADADEDGDDAEAMRIAPVQAKGDEHEND